MKNKEKMKNKDKIKILEKNCEKLKNMYKEVRNIKKECMEIGDYTVNDIVEIAIPIRNDGDSLISSLLSFRLLLDNMKNTLENDE